MRPKPLPVLSLMVCFALGACSHPGPQDQAFLSPDGSAWVHMETVPVDANKDQLLPTTRLVLQQRWNWGAQLLLEDIESLCGVQVLWVDAQTLGLRVPGARGKHLRIKDGETWHGILLRTQLHEAQVKPQALSPDGQRRLIVVSTCETDDWNLYLRRAGEPTFNAAMETGWDDPDLFGGFSGEQAPVSLRWTGPRSGEISVIGKNPRVTVRKQVGDVTVKWKFLESAIPPKPAMTTLEPIKAKP